MKIIPLDNVETVQYQDFLMNGWLTSIHVVFCRPRETGNYFGPGLRLALALLREQFPPSTNPEKMLVQQPFLSKIDFDIEPNTLRMSVPLDKLKRLDYRRLSAAQWQAKQFSHFQSDGHSFKIEELLTDIQSEMNRKKTQ
jgi:hypothetical protein